MERVSWAGAESVYAMAYRDLLRVAFVLTGSGAAAEDVVHDVFCRVGPRIAELDNPAAYLRVAVVNQCRSIHRRIARAPRLDRSPEIVLDTGIIELRDALHALPVRQRTAIVLRYLCDLPEAEIAGILGCRPTTVRTLVHRGLADLRTRISDPAREPARDPAREPARDPAREPAREPARDPAREPAREPARDETVATIEPTVTPPTEMFTRNETTHG